MTDPLVDLAQLDGVPSAVAAARAGIDAVLRDRGHRSVPRETSIAALLAGARASARLTQDPARWLPGAVRLATEVPALAQGIRTTPAQTLARAHALVAHGLVPDDELGRLSAVPGIAERMAGLCRLLSTPTAAPALLLAAVAHAEVATLRPFGSGDQVLGRAVERMVLVSTGVDPHGVIVPEAGHLARSPAYASGLRAYATGSLAGVRTWLLHCAAAINDGAEASPLAGQAHERPAPERPAPESTRTGPDVTRRPR